MSWLGDPQRQIAETGRPDPVSIPVPLGFALWSSFVLIGSHPVAGFQFDDSLSGEGGDLFQEIGVYYRIEVARVFLKGCILIVRGRSRFFVSRFGGPETESLNGHFVK
jgi:hypothetical protein